MHQLHLSLLLVAAVALPAPSAASAALPVPGDTYRAHDHDTPDDKWHVTMKALREKQALRVVVYADRCGGHTPYAKVVPYDGGGNSKTYRFLDPDNPEKGTWAYDARFTGEDRLEGTFRIVTEDCDTGPMPFVATNTAETHVSYGTPLGSMPDLASATPRRLRQADWLFREAWRRAKRFADIEKAKRLGYYSGPSDFAERRAHVYHLRHLAFTKDEIYFNPKKTESLMYYNGLEGPPVLIGYMFRYKLAGGHPPFARPLLGWHAHGRAVWRGIPNQMTHIWLTNDLRSALANCMPVEALEASLPAFEFSPMQPDVIAEARPCPSAS